VGKKAKEKEKAKARVAEGRAPQNKQAEAASTKNGMTPPLAGEEDGRRGPETEVPHREGFLQ
jgi:hypothetical protein